MGGPDSVGVVRAVGGHGGECSRAGRVLVRAVTTASGGLIVSGQPPAGTGASCAAASGDGLPAGVSADLLVAFDRVQDRGQDLLRFLVQGRALIVPLVLQQNLVAGQQHAVPLTAAAKALGRRLAFGQRPRRLAGAGSPGPAGPRRSQQAQHGRPP